MEVSAITPFAVGPARGARRAGRGHAEPPQTIDITGSVDPDQIEPVNFDRSADLIGCGVKSFLGNPQRGR